MVLCKSNTWMTNRLESNRCTILPILMRSRHIFYIACNINMWRVEVALSMNWVEYNQHKNYGLSALFFFYLLKIISCNWSAWYAIITFLQSFSEIHRNCTKAYNVPPALQYVTYSCVLNIIASFCGTLREEIHSRVEIWAIDKRLLQF